MPISYRITAIEGVSLKRVHIFTVTGDPEAGVARAKREAQERKLGGYFSDYRADPVVDHNSALREAAEKRLTLVEDYKGELTYDLGYFDLDLGKIYSFTAELVFLVGQDDAEIVLVPDDAQIGDRELFYSNPIIGPTVPIKLAAQLTSLLGLGVDVEWGHDLNQNFDRFILVAKGA